MTLWATPGRLWTERGQRWTTRGPLARRGRDGGHRPSPVWTDFPGSTSVNQPWSTIHTTYYCPCKNSIPF